MAQQIKKKFLSQEIIDFFENQIEAVDTKVDQEVIDRQSAISALQQQIDGLGGNYATDAELASAVASLQGSIDVEKGRIDSILALSEVDKDSFKELVDLILNIDTENDSLFAGYVASNNAALAQEVSDRQSGDAQTLVDAKAYTDAQIAAIPEVDLSNYYTKSEVDSKESALQSSISNLDVYAQDIRSDVDGHETRIAALEALTDGPSFANGSVLVGEELGFIDLDREYIKLMSCAVGRMAVHEGEDYTVSVVAGKTRLTWINSLANPSGLEKIETGDKVFFVGAY